MKKIDKQKWEEYKQSIEGRLAIEAFEDLLSSETESKDILEISQKYNCRYFHNSESTDFDWFKERFDIYSKDIASFMQFLIEKNGEDINEIDPEYFFIQYLFSILTSPEEDIKRFDEIPQNRFKWMLGEIVPLSIALFRVLPDWFLPNLYVMQFEYFEATKKFYGIEIPEMPEIPKRPDYSGRVLYYMYMSFALNEFMADNEIYDPAEVCAFFFDYEVHRIDKEIEKELNERDKDYSKRVWLLVGNYYGNEKTMEMGFWQANPDTSKGDILMFYEKSPVKAMNSCWTAKSDGVKDPFFMRYSYVLMDNQIKIPEEMALTFQDFKNSEYFQNRDSKGNFVKKNFQDTSGWAITERDFIEILSMLESKGYDINKLPKLD